MEEHESNQIFRSSKIAKCPCCKSEGTEQKGYKCIRCGKQCCRNCLTLISNLCPDCLGVKYNEVHHKTPESDR